MFRVSPILPSYPLAFSLAFVLALAACDSPSGPVVIECGGGAQFKCPPGLYCDLGPTCGGIDHYGKCVRQPVDCPSEDHLVCGCDDMEYNSPCFANANGVTVAYKGPCLKE